MANTNIYITIILLSALVSGILSQNEQNNNMSPPVSNQIGADPTPSPPPPPKCNLVPAKPNVDSQSQKFKVVTNSTVANKTVEHVCVLAEFNAVLLVNGSSPQYLNLGKGIVNKSSTCDETTKHVNLVVDYACGQISMQIVGNQTVSVNSIHGLFNLDGQTKPVDFTHEGPLFKTSKAGYYYRCNSEQNLPLKIVNMSTVENYSLLMSNVGFEAFPDKNQDSFTYPPEVCEADSKHVNDLVPIAVGACLAALVVIVLIAYFVGRRRWSERSTYESV